MLKLHLEQISVVDPDIDLIKNYQQHQLPLLLNLPTSKSMIKIVDNISENYFYTFEFLSLAIDSVQFRETIQFYA